MLKFQALQSVVIGLSVDPADKVLIVNSKLLLQVSCDSVWISHVYPCYDVGT